MSIICLNCSRLRASDCLLFSITVLLERRFLLGDGVCCEDELDDLFSRSFLLDIRGCRVYARFWHRCFITKILEYRNDPKFNGTRTSCPQIYAATVTRLAAMVARPKSTKLSALPTLQVPCWPHILNVTGFEKLNFDCDCVLALYL